MKKRAKDQVIKALAVGLSAAMLLQPTAALADEVKPEDNTEALKNAEAQAEEETKVSDVKETTAEAKSEMGDFYGENPFIFNGDVDKVFIDTDNLLKTEGFNPDKEIIKDEAKLGTDVFFGELPAKSAMAEIESDLGNLETIEAEYVASDNLANTAAVSGNDAVSDGDAAAATAEKIANDVSAQVAEYQENVNKAADDLKNATTIAAANAAFNDISANVTAADEAVTKAQKDYEDAAKDYDAAVDAYKKAKEIYDAAMAENAAATVSFNEIANDVSENAAIVNSIAEVTDKDLEALKAAVEKSHDKFIATGMGLIVTLEEQAKDGIKNSSDWNKVMDPLFEALLEYYYIPSVEGGKLENVEWVKSKDDSQNYCVVTYTVKNRKGETQTVTKNLNYKLADDNKKGGLIIFEKQVRYNADGTILSDNEEELLESKGYVVLQDGKVVVADDNGKLFVSEESEDNTTVVNKITESETVEINMNTQSVEYSMQNGVITKTVTADVTTKTVSTSEETIGAGNKDYLKEADARDAAIAKLQEIVDGLDNNQTVKIGDRSFKKGDTVDGTAINVTVEATPDAYNVTAKYVVTYTDVDPYWNIGGREYNEHTVSDKYFVGYDWNWNECYGTDYQHCVREAVSVNKDTITVNEDELKKSVSEKIVVNDNEVHVTNEDRNKINRDEVAKTVTDDDVNAKYIAPQRGGSYQWVWVYYPYYGERRYVAESDESYNARVNSARESARNAAIDEKVNNAAFEAAKERVWKEKYNREYATAYNDAKQKQYIDAIEAEGKAKAGAADAEYKYVAYENGKYIVHYVPYMSVSVASDVSGNADELTDENRTALENQAKAAVQNVKIDDDFDFDRWANQGKAEYKGVSIEKVAKMYGFSELSYYIETVSKTTERKAVEVVTFNEKSEVQTLYTNENFNNGNILLAEYDLHGTPDYSTEDDENKYLDWNQKGRTQDLRNKLAYAENKAKIYNKLLAELNTADQDIHDLEENIAMLKAQIAVIMKGGSEAKLAEFTAKLDEAEAILSATVELRDALKEKLDTEGEELDRKIRELTPAPSNDEPEITPEQETVVVIPTVTNPARPRRAAAPVVAETPEEEIVEVVAEVEIAEEEAPKAETIEEATEEKVEEAAPVVIEDQDTPLAPNEDAKQMSWWWILVVLVFGTTGAELFRRHQLKKNAAKVEE